MIACLNNIIGLTRTSCAAFTENLGTDPVAEWYKKSESGLFLDEVPGIPTIKAVEQSLRCQETMVEFYQQSIETAKTELRDDLLVGISDRYRQAAKNYIGVAGGRSYTQALALAGALGGIHLQNTWVRGGKIKINGIYGVFQTPPTELQLYKISKETTPQALQFMQTIPVTFAPGAETYYALTTPIELSTDGYEYALLYDIPAAVPFNTNVSCGCGASELQMKRYLNLAGLAGTDLTNFSTWSKTQNSNGIALNIEIGCDASNIMCDLFTSDISFKTVIAHAVRFKAAELVVEKVQSSEEVNRYTMMSREYLWGKRNHYQKEYLDRVNWMVQTMDVGGITDCFICNHSHKSINKGRILA